MESFFAMLKGELVEEHDHLTRDAARTNAFQYVEGICNRCRLQAAIGYLTPEEANFAAAAQVVQCP